MKNIIAYNIIVKYIKFDKMDEALWNKNKCQPIWKILPKGSNIIIMYG
jgi:hypothetical protein